MQLTKAPPLLLQGDCLELMDWLPDQSVDLVLCDLPYGTTQNKWDSVIPFEPLWHHYRRLCRGAVVLTASQPFTSALVMSNPKQFKHEWVWIKNRGSNFANTVREPFKEHESVAVFAATPWTYNKQMQERTGAGVGAHLRTYTTERKHSENYGRMPPRPEHLTEMRVPASWQRFDTERGLHPTQKPVALMEYMIRTYTNPGDVVLDNCMGSGTTGVAALQTGRHFIGMELDEASKVAVNRINAVQAASSPAAETVRDRRPDLDLGGL